jgi:hypothetical protein
MFELDNPYQAFPVSTSFKRYLGFLNRCFLLCYDQIGRLVYIVSTTIWLQHSSKFLSERNLDSAHGRRRSRSDFVCVPLGGFGEVSESDAALRARDPAFAMGEPTRLSTRPIPGTGTPASCEGRLRCNVRIGCIGRNGSVATSHKKYRRFVDFP